MIRVNSCGEKEHPEWWIESKTHQDYDLWYIYEGDIEIRINEQIYHASKGDLVLFCPKVSYTATTNHYGCRFNFTHFEFGLGNHFGILDNFKLSGIIKRDRKSTRLNSSHVAISYAVFCLKKKTKY